MASNKSTETIGYVANYIDLGNGESVRRGVFETTDGRFLAMTFTRSKTFETRIGAERWLKRLTKV